MEACTGSGKTLAFVIPIVEKLRRLEAPLKKHQVGDDGPGGTERGGTEGGGGGGGRPASAEGAGGRLRWHGPGPGQDDARVQIVMRCADISLCSTAQVACHIRVHCTMTSTTSKLRRNEQAAADLGRHLP